MDYPSLVTQIQNTCNRTDAYFLSQIPDFIDRGISRIYYDAKNIGFQKIANTGTNFTSSNPLILKPADWKETISLSYTIPGATPFTTYVFPRTYEFCKTYWPNVTSTGQPVFYADYNLPTSTTGPGNLYLAPTPNSTYAYELIYLSTPLFNVDNPRNFLTDQYPLLLLDVCMVEAVTFLKDDERIAAFEASYQRALAAINNITQERYTDRTSKRNKD